MSKPAAQNKPHAPRRQTGIRRAPPSKIVSAFACGQCSKVYTDEPEARECCACDVCGTKFPHTGYGQSTCGYCRRPALLRELEQQVGNVVAHLKTLKQRLTRLQRTPRPPKGAPQEK